MSNIDVKFINEQISVLQEAIKEVLSGMSLEDAQEFMRIFNEKLGKLNEQKRPQENSGASR